MDFRNLKRARVSAEVPYSKAEGWKGHAEKKSRICNFVFETLRPGGGELKMTPKRFEALCKTLGECFYGKDDRKDDGKDDGRSYPSVLQLLDVGR